MAKKIFKIRISERMVIGLGVRVRFGPAPLSPSRTSEQSPVLT